MVTKIPIKADWIVPFLIATLGFLGSLFTGYTHNDKDLTSRVSKLEAHREDDRDDISYIRDQVDKLVVWATGHK